jgi:hypothetical protein
MFFKKSFIFVFKNFIARFLRDTKMDVACAYPIV